MPLAESCRGKEVAFPAGDIPIPVSAVWVKRWVVQVAEIHVIEWNEGSGLLPGQFAGPDPAFLLGELHVLRSNDAIHQEISTGHCTHDRVANIRLVGHLFVVQGVHVFSQITKALPLLLLPGLACQKSRGWINFDRLHTLKRTRLPGERNIQAGRLPQVVQ